MSMLLAVELLFRQKTITTAEVVEMGVHERTARAIITKFVRAKLCRIIDYSYAAKSNRWIPIYGVPEIPVVRTLEQCKATVEEPDIHHVKPQGKILARAASVPLTFVGLANFYAESA